MPLTFQNHIAQKARLLDDKVEAAVRRGAEQIVKGAQERVPVSPYAPHLKDAIHIEDSDDGTEVVAGDNDTFYGHMVEHGTSHSPAHPFLIPAAEAARDEIQREIEQALRRWA